MIGRGIARLRRLFDRGAPPAPPVRRGLLFGPCPSQMPAQWGIVADHPRYREEHARLASLVHSRMGVRPVIGAPVPSGIADRFAHLVAAEVTHQLAQLAVLWAEGISYDWAAGLSVGEYGAAAAAGLISIDDALAITIATLQGCMADRGGDLVLLGPKAHARLGAAPLPYPLSMRGANSLVLAVGHEQLARFVRETSGAIPLGFDVRPHTAYTSLEPLRAVIAGVPVRTPAIPLYLASTGGRVTEAFDGAAWERILTSTARIDALMAALARDVSGEVVHVATLVMHYELEPSGLLARCASRDASQLLAATQAGRQLPTPAIRREDPAVRRDPHVAYERCRHADIAWLGQREAIAISHQAVQEVLRRAESFSSAPNASYPVLHGADGETHARRRRALAPYFTPERQRARATELRAIVAERVAELRTRDRFQLVGDLALPAPRRSTCAWLGIREHMADALLALPPRELTWDQVEPHLESRGLVRELRASGGLSDGELAQLAPFLLVAGLTTVTDFVVNAVCALHERPAMLAQLRHDPSLLPSYLDELLRLEPPVHALPRVATTDTMIAESSIPRGTIVHCGFGAGNRDPHAFPRPNALLPEREDARSLTFGFGPHYCLGATTGRAFSEILLAAILFDLADFAPREDVVMQLARTAPQFAIRRRLPDLEFVRERSA